MYVCVCGTVISLSVTPRKKRVDPHEIIVVVVVVCVVVADSSFLRAVECVPHALL